MMKWLLLAGLSVSGFNLLGLGTYDPAPLANLTTDSHHGKQTTYDVTTQTNVEELKRVLPGVFEASPLAKSSASASTYTIAYARLASRLSRLTSLRHNAMIPMKTNFKSGYMYQIRYVEVPGEENPGPQTFAVGITSLDTYASGWTAKSILVGTEGNLQAKGAIATGFTDRWGVGDYVDWFIEIRDVDHSRQEVDIFIAINGKSFGHAFHLNFDSSVPNQVERLRPIISFSENSDKAAVMAVVFEGTKISKSATYRQAAPPSENEIDPTVDPLVGNWSQGTSTRLVIREGDKSPEGSKAFRLTAKIINTINMNFSVDSNGRITSKSPAISTLMAGPADKMAIEQNFVAVLNNLDRVQTDGKTLTLSCPDRSKLTFEKYYPNPVDPATYNPFTVQE